MKKTTKSLVMILGMGFAVTTANAIEASLKARRKRQQFEAEEERAQKAFEEFCKLNGPTERLEIEYASDTGGTPIYTYSESFQPEQAHIPDGYVLHKLIHASGCVNYAYGLELSEKDEFADYHVFFYLEDEKEWYEWFDHDLDEDVR